MSRPKTANTKIAKMDTSFYNAVSEIAKKRFALGLDKNYSPPTVQRKIIKHNAWQQMRKDLEIAKFLKDESGEYSVMFAPFKFMIVIFLAVVFFGGLIYVTGLLNNSFLEIGLNNEGNAGTPGYTNLTQASQNTFGKVNESIGGLRMVAIAMIFAEILMILVINSFMRIHPMFFMVWVLIVFLAVIFSAPIANSYESLLQSGIYGGGLESFTGANWILLNLPIVVMLVGILGGIFMFINIIRGGSDQGLA